MSRGCVEDEEPSFQCECRVEVPHVGHGIEPAGNIDGYAWYGLQRMTKGRYRSSSCNWELPIDGLGGVMIV